MNAVSVEAASGRQKTMSRPEWWNSLLQSLERLIREPLLHFLCIGLAVFAVYAYMHRGRGGVESSRRIVLSLEVAAGWVVNEALREAEFGNSSEARQGAALRSHLLERRFGITSV